VLNCILELVSDSIYYYFNFCILILYCWYIITVYYDIVISVQLLLLYYCDFTNATPSRRITPSSRRGSSSWRKPRRLSRYETINVYTICNICYSYLSFSVFVEFQ
jgi:hypothetical protein